MAEEQRASLFQLLNGPTPHPTPEPAPSAPPVSASAPPPPPPPWPVPAPPAAGGTGSITYTESALEHFAQTSDERAAEFGQAGAEAARIQVSRDAFGYMFGALVYGAYEKHVQAVTGGIQAGQTAMTEIATAIRESAARIHAVNEGVEHDLGQPGGGS